MDTCTLGETIVGGSWEYETLTFDGHRIELATVPVASEQAICSTGAQGRFAAVTTTPALCLASNT